MKKVLVVICMICVIIFNVMYLKQDLMFSLVIVACSFMGMYAFRVFETQEMQSTNNQISRIIIGTILEFLFLAMVESLILFLYYPIYTRNITKPLLINNFVFNIVFFTVMHRIYYIFARKNIVEKKYVFIGDKSKFGVILKEIEKKSFGKVKILESFLPGEKNFLSDLNIKIKELTANQNKITLLLENSKIEEELKQNIPKNRLENISFRYFPNVAEKYLQRIPLEILDANLDYYRVVLNEVAESPEKRLFDVIISTVALVVLSPVILILGLVIVLENGFPIVFKQERVGLGGSSFLMHKFRSMRKKKKKMAKFASDELGRITLIGKLMRPVRLDEILQFYDIILGKMSFIGPRPEQVEIVNRYNNEIHFYSLRHKLKPGLTGWAQIMYQYSSNLEETKIKLSYDLYYIKNRDLIFDIQIILKTIEAVMWKRGAV